MPEQGIVKKDHLDILSVEQIIEIASACAKLGIDKIRLTGGEPLVRRGIIDIVKGLSKIPNIKCLAITTNGILLDEYAVELIESGITRINISLDTLNKDKYFKLTRGGNIDDVFKGIKTLKRLGFKDIRINTVLLKKFNDDEIESLCAFAHDNDLYLRFIELMPIGESIKLAKDNFESVQSVLSRMPNLVKCLDSGVATNYEFSDHKGKIGLISPLSNIFCSSCNRIRLTSDGRIKPCLHSKEEIDLNGLTGEDLVNKIKESILAKPKSHHLQDEESSSLRGMSEIGG